MTDRAGKSTRQRVEVDTGPLYGVFVRRVLETYTTGFEGLPSLEDLHATMQLVDRVYAAARSCGLEQPSP